MAGEELRHTGKVVELKGKLAVVRFQRSDACGHCNACFHFGSNEADIEELKAMWQYQKKI